MVQVGGGDGEVYTTKHQENGRLRRKIMRPFSLKQVDQQGRVLAFIHCTEGGIDTQKSPPLLRKTNRAKQIFKCRTHIFAIHIRLNNENESLNQPQKQLPSFHKPSTTERPTSTVPQVDSSQEREKRKMSRSNMLLRRGEKLSGSVIVARNKGIYTGEARGALGT